MLRRIKQAFDSSGKRKNIYINESESRQMEASVPSVRQAHVGPHRCDLLAASQTPLLLSSDALRTPQMQNFSLQSNFPERIAARAAQSEADILQGEGVGSPIV